MTRRVVRQNIVRQLRRKMMGPGARDEVIDTLPTVQYVTGIVYPFIEKPVEKPKHENDDDTGQDDEVMDEEQETHSDSHLPRSMGLSTLVAVDDLTESGVSVTVDGAIYRQEGTAWMRVPISANELPIELSKDSTGISFGDKKLTRSMPLESLPGAIGGDLRGFSLVWESSRFIDDSSPGGKWYLSVFLVNNRRCVSSKRASNSLYQAYLRVSTGDKRAIGARDTHIARNDEDMRSLSLLYSDRREYGVGHMCSVNWDSRNGSDALIGCVSAGSDSEEHPSSLIPSANVDCESGRCAAVETTFFPEYHSRAPDFEVKSDGNTLSLGMHQLSDEDYLDGGEGRRSENIGLLTSLAKKYEDWIASTFSISEAAEHSGFEAAFRANREQCIASLARMREGIDVLSDNDKAYAAFCFMNRAIWLQYINKAASKKAAGAYVVDLSDHRGWWRPFQLAFILQIIPSLIDEKHDDRDVLDLLWVQTGGGKTEAYLGLVAFLLFINRLRKKASPQDGVEVMMRYTLRLLTLQQFQRAARLILACEYIRLCDLNSGILGQCKPFSLGLYVGQSTTPNRVKTGKAEGDYDNDYDLYERLYMVDKQRYETLEQCGSTAEYAIRHWAVKHKLPEDQNPVQILNCPWCGEQMKANDFRFVEHFGEWTIETRCSNKLCCFHRNTMPIYTVDDCIHNEPPSLLIGTVDKFAQLPFNEDMESLFGWREGNPVGAPPSLIIQDELHLINGPLGSMVGLYEATIDLLSSRGTKASAGLTLDNLGTDDVHVSWERRPKIIASTATIRNARAQCRQLYDRRVSKFPAAGTSIVDSFFVKERGDDDNDKAYVGILCAGVAAKTGLKKCISEIVNLVSEERERRSLSDVDSYWTTVSYFNSRRELGGAVTLLRDDVRNAVAARRPSMMMERSIGELHGGLSSTELPDVLRRMNVTADGTDPYDVICCTNMFSVGVDVDRLGLMVMNCQPNATTEYLQSTGRVGRTGDGLVVTLFNPTRPRDQSHFECYYDYHSRIQLHVESMTVTPYSEGCLERAMHAQYVAMMRQMFPGCDLPRISANTECKDYSRKHRAHDTSLMFMHYLIQRARAITASESCRLRVVRTLLLFQEEWFRRIDEAKDLNGGGKLKFLYQQRSNWQYHDPRLLETDPSSQWFKDSFSSPKRFVNKPILTPNSLRNVEAEVDFVELEARR